jgi:hypothetical protein
MEFLERESGKVVRQGVGGQTSIVTCITSEHHRRARVGVGKVPRPRVLCLAEQVQHHANEASEHSNSSRDAEQRRKIRCDD